MVELVPNEDDNEGERLRAHQFVPKFSDHDMVEPIRPDLLEWLQDEPEVNIVVNEGSHLDYAWYREREPSKMREIEAFVKVVKVDKFTLEQMITAKEFIEGGGKNMKQDLLDMIREGRMELVDMYVQPDKFLSPQESTFKNFQFGRRVAEQLGGRALDFEYIPDTFGFPDSTPMVLRHAGKRSILFQRGFEHLDTQGAFFWWEHTDGSRILALPMQGGYSNAANIVKEMPEIPGGLSKKKRVELADRQLQEQVEHASLCVRALINRFGDRYKQTGIPHMLLMNCNDFTKPSKELPLVLDGVQEQMRQYIPNLSITSGTLGQYSDMIHDAVAQKPDQITTYRGEMRSGREHFVLRGTDSTRMPLKQYFNRVGTRMLDAGTAAALVLLGRKHKNPAYGGKRLVENEHQTWQLVDGYENSEMMAQPVTSHDTILGCGDDAVYALAMSQMTGSYHSADQVVRNATAVLAGRHDTYGPYRHIERGQSFINFLNEARTTYVEVPLQGDIEHARALRGFANINGQEVPVDVQIIQKKDIRYAVCVMPMEGMSATNVRLEPIDEPVDHEVREFDGTVENEFYAVTVMPNGSLHIQDKQTKVDMMGLVFEDEGDRGDEYNFCPVDSDTVRVSSSRPAKVRVVNDGPVFTELQIDTELTIPKSLDAEQGAEREVETRSGEIVKVPISTRMRLIKGIDRIEFSTIVNNTARDHRLRVRFETSNAGDTVRAKEPYGMTVREAVPIKGGEGWAEPLPVATSHQQGLLAAGDLALFTKGLPEYEAYAEKTMGKDYIESVALTLFRSVGYLSRGNLKTRPGWAGPGSATPDAQLPGELPPFEYAINLRGKQANSSLIHQLDDYTHKAEGGFENAAMNGIVNMKSEGNRAVRSELFPSSDGQAAIIEIYNPDDEPTTVTLSGIFKHAVKCDAYGNPIDTADAHQFELPPGMVSVRLS